MITKLSGVLSRWARAISSRTRTCIAPWLSSPVSASVRAACCTLWYVSALRQATVARSAIASSVRRSSSSIRRIVFQPTDSAPLSSWFQTIGTAIAVRKWAIEGCGGCRTSRW